MTVTDNLSTCYKSAPYSAAKRWGIRMVLLLAAAWFSATSIATTEDRNQPIDLSADQASINQNTGTATYIGNVKINQGSMQIRAARVEITRRQNGSIRAVITGQPASFQQRLKANDAPVTATASRIIYDSDTKVVKLRGNAELERAGDTIRSDEIDLDNGTGRLRAGGGSERVRMSFDPPPPSKD